MNEKQLALFLAVAEHGSFSKAEEAEYISKQAMLRQINSLEQEVGVPLMVRSTSGISLTPAGDAFYQGAKELLALRKDVLARCRGAEPQPEVLRIGQVEHQTLLHRVTDAFMAKYPDIQIQKVIHPNHSGEYRVTHGITDVGETFYTRLTANDPFSYTKLADMPYRVAMSRRHPLSGRERLSLEELTAYPTTLFARMTKRPYQEALRAAFARMGREENLRFRDDVDNQVDVAFQCSDSEELLVTANGFVTEIPQLVTVLLEDGWYEEYGIIYRPHPSSIVQKYIDLAAEIYRNLSAEAL